MSTDQPLVEAWGVRDVDERGLLIEASSYENSATASADIQGCTVVPLIAADRLTDRDLWAGGPGDCPRGHWLR